MRTTAVINCLPTNSPGAHWPFTSTTVLSFLSEDHTPASGPLRPARTRQRPRFDLIAEKGSQGVTDFGLRFFAATGLIAFFVVAPTMGRSFISAARHKYQ